MHNYMDMYITNQSTYYYLTYIYGLLERSMRSMLWRIMIDMAEIGLHSGKPRVILDDFNDIKSNVDKL